MAYGPLTNTPVMIISATYVLCLMLMTYYVSSYVLCVVNSLMVRPKFFDPNSLNKKSYKRAKQSWYFSNLPLTVNTDSTWMMLIQVHIHEHTQHLLSMYNYCGYDYN